MKSLWFILNALFSPRFNAFRIQILFFAFGFLLFVLLSSLFYVQVLSQSHFIQLASKNRIRRVLVEAPRGQILDRNGNILAENRARFDLVLIREELPKEKGEYVEFLSKILNFPQKEIWKTLQTTVFLPYKPALLMRDVDLSLVARVEERQRELPGIHVQVEPGRFYHLGNSASHIIGAIGKIPQEEAEVWKEKGIQLEESIGRSGIERALDEHLRGVVGGQQVQVNNRGYLDEVIGSKDPIPGKDLVLSIDARLQECVAQELKDKKGGAIVMDVRTGEILACVSQPAFDSNILSDGLNREEIQNYFQNPDRLLFSRFSLGNYSPGSLFKLIVALAYMKKYPDTWKEKFVFCDGEFRLGKASFRCWQKKGHGSVHLIDAIKYSCNLYFYEIGLELGPQPIAQMASRFGFGKPTGFLLPEKEGLVPTPKWKKKTFKEDWYGGDTVNLSIGQGAILCTPLQMVVFIATIASDGVSHSPVLIAGGKSAVRDLAELKPEIQVVKEGMRRVVQEGGGTAQRAWTSQMPAAGKTGTVEVVKTEELKIKHTWFAGYAPYDKPEIAVVVLVEEGVSGGQTAAPIAGAIFKKYAELL